MKRTGLGGELPTDFQLLMISSLDKLNAVAQKAAFQTANGRIAMTTYVGTLGDDNHTGNEDGMYGLDGNDTVGSTVGSTTYRGEGNDSLQGGQPNAPLVTLYGRNGNDTLAGFGAMYGGEGSDLISASQIGGAYGGA
ncbi:hypothetical protein [Bradyrhizobium sp. JYMT SZCCT0428]|uniref:hypothetical protein n=1 Tax=Bradyrhizobium sp. JYMT SZCCT0428 TaxID=2807673 RepID=UPI001BABA370|nr:hypothetical protein [Bradyrhizobium sp. JYMT SZCCT0428]MBR1153720.1 hypothetical protein [Bradyrhizobium sp. JYMT SZCCT0428]